MRKYLLPLCLLPALALNAKPVSPVEAQNAADAFINLRLGKTRTNLTPANPNAALTRSSEDQPYYVFNVGKNDGFVIISGDDRFSKVLGYTDNGSFNLKDIPPQLKFLLDNFAEKSKNSSGWESTHSSWGQTFATRADEGVLLKTENWGQRWPYNTKCPLFPREDTQLNAPTGCVATAMAIIMQYHKWPESYNWDAMPTDVSYDKEMDVNANYDEVAQLMFDIGTSVHMEYDLSESGAQSYYVAPALRNKFGYSPSSQYTTRNYYSDEKWKNLVKENIDNGNPIYYSGTNYDRQTAHAFVIDGYNESEVHVNWGWDGSSNGFYALDLLDPSVYKFTDDHAMCYDIIPNKSGIKYSDLYVDYGYGNNPPKNMPDGYNINMSVSEVKTGEPFTFIVNQVHVPQDFSGNFGVALVSKNNEIKEVIKCEDIRNIGYAYTTESENHNLKFSVEIDPDDRVQLVSKRDSDTDYMLIPGSREGFSSLPAVGNVPQYATIKVNVGKNVEFYYRNNGDLYWQGEGSIRNPYKEGVHEFSYLKGSLFHHSADLYSHRNTLGIMPLMVRTTETMPDGNTSVRQRGMSDDFSFYPAAPFTVYGDCYEMDVYFNEPTSSDAWEKTINLTEAGTLEKVLSEKDAMALKKLTLTGVMNAKDFWYIRDTGICLYELDLSGIEKIESVRAVDETVKIALEMPMTDWPENTLPDYALYTTKNLQTIILPPIVKELQKYAFHSTALTSITIPASVEKIGDAVFRSCDNLKTVTVLNPLPIVIGPTFFANASAGAKLTLYVPEGSEEAYKASAVWKDFGNILTGEAPIEKVYDKIIDNVWYHVENGIAQIKGSFNAENIIISGEIEIDGKSYEITSIPDNAFAEAKSLKSVVIDDKITYLGQNAFAGCVSLESVEFGKGITTILPRTFDNCENLKEIVLPETIKTLEGEAFYKTGLEKITLSKNTRPADPASSPFVLNSKLKSFVVPEDNEYYASFDGALYVKADDGFHLSIMPAGKDEKVTLSPDCKFVDTGAIDGCEKLPAIEFNEGVVIKERGVSYRNEAGNIILPADITLMPNAFNYCRMGYGSVTFKSMPKSTEKPFSDSYIASVIIDSGDEEITLSEDILSPNAVYTTSLKKNFEIGGKHHLYFPFGAEEAFPFVEDGDVLSQAAMWNMNLDKKVGLMEISTKPSDIVKIDKVKVNGEAVSPVFGVYPINVAEAEDLEICYLINNVVPVSTHYDAAFIATIPDTELDIEGETVAEDVVYSCSNGNAVVARYTGEDASLTLPETIEVEGIEFPVTEIADEAFSGNSTIESVEIPNSITKLGAKAFYYCSNLKEVVLGSGITAISESAFENCTALEKLEIPESVELIGNDAFSNSGLKEVKLHKKVGPTYAWSRPFQNMQKLEKIEVEEGNPYYMAVDNALYDIDGEIIRLECVAANVTTLTLPDNCTQILGGALAAAKNLDKIVFNDRCNYLGKDVLTENILVSHLTFPYYMNVEDEALAALSNLQSVTLSGNINCSSPLFGANSSLSHVMINSEYGEINLDAFFSADHPMISIYSGALEKNVTYSGECELYVPGGTADSYAATRSSEVKEMWSYQINRKDDRKVEIHPLDMVKIDKITINGKDYEPTEEGAYELSDTENIDIKMEYTLLGHQKLTTHYTPEFNSRIPDSELSGVGGIGVESGATDVYGVDGRLYLKNANKSDINRLKPGIYLLRRGKHTEKIIIR